MSATESLIYDSTRIGTPDSVVTAVDWRAMSDSQRETVEARVRAAHGTDTRTNADGDRRTIEREDRHGCHVLGYLSRRALITW